MSEKDLNKLSQLFDHLLNLDEPPQREQTEKILHQDEQARQLYTALQRALEPLNTFEQESPPPRLAERTLDYITQHQHIYALERLYSNYLSSKET